MNTSFEEFKKLFKKIPPERLKNVMFIALRNGTKIPYFQGSWKNEKNQLNYYQVKNWMRSGGNIGVVARFSGILMLDIDIDENSCLLASTQLLECIPKTFVVRTRSGGLHYYFLNDGEYDNQLFRALGKDVGELRANWQYVVSPGSWVEPTTYQVLQDEPLAKFEGKITEFFEKYKEKSEKKVEKKEKTIMFGKVGKTLTEEIKNKLQTFKQSDEERRKQLIQLLSFEVK